MHTPRKRFGQNFLIDDGIVHAIVNAIHPQAPDTVGARSVPASAR